MGMDGNGLVMVDENDWCVDGNGSSSMDVVMGEVVWMW